MADEQITSPPAEGVSEDKKPTESQPTVPSSQEPAQPEKAGQTQVEGTVEQPLQAEEETRQPSDYYKSRDKYRRRVDSLEQTVSDLQNQITTKDQPTVPSTDPGRLDAQKLYDNPEAVFLEREKQMEERMTRKFEQQQADFTHKQKQQEALEFIFPRTSPESRESLQQRVSKNPVKAERIQEILAEEGLDEFSKINPSKAAEITLGIYNQEVKPKRTTNPQAISK